MEELGADHGNNLRSTSDMLKRTNLPGQISTSSTPNSGSEAILSPSSPLSSKWKKNFKASWIKPSRTATAEKSIGSVLFEPGSLQDARDSLSSSFNSIPIKTGNTPPDSSSVTQSKLDIAKQTEAAADAPAHRTTQEFGDHQVPEGSGNKGAKPRRLKRLFSASGNKKSQIGGPATVPQAPTSPTPPWKPWSTSKTVRPNISDGATPSRSPLAMVPPMAPNRIKETKPRDPKLLPHRKPDSSPSPTSRHRYPGRRRDSTSSPSTLGSPLKRGGYTQSPQSAGSYDSGDIIARAPSFQATYSPMVCMR